MPIRAGKSPWQVCYRIIPNNQYKMKIDIKKKLPEKMIQYEVFRILRELNISCILEYTTKLPSTGKYVRFDIIVHRGDDVVCIVETKTYNSDRPANKSTKQFSKYSEFNVPIVYICNPYQIINGVKEIQSLLK
jgi:hypothetical protein